MQSLNLEKKKQAKTKRHPFISRITNVKKYNYFVPGHKMKSLHKRWDNMDNDVGRRPGRHLQETKKLQIHQMKRSGCKNKEIAAALKVSIRTIQRVKVPPSLETAV